MNNKVLWIVGGCAVLLLLCCVVSVVGYLVVWPSIQSQILGTLGTSVELPLGTVAPALPPVGGKITPGALPTLGTTSSRSSASSSSSSVAAGTGNPFTDAMGKATSASKYRMEFSWVFGGVQSGKYQEQPFFDMAGEVDGTSSHLTSKGGMMAMLGGSQTANIEIVEAGGKTYMKGVTMFGLTDPKLWYITDDSSTSGFKDFAKPDEWSSFAGGNQKDFKKVRSESVDNQSCDVWMYDFKSTQNAALSGMLSLGGGTNSGSFSAIDKAEVDVWLCSDGYVHKYLVDYEGHDSKDATQKGALKINAHTWDFNNAAIKVTVPTDAKPMPK